jgi:dynein heavy chain 1
MSKLKDEHDNLSRAKEALSLTVTVDNRLVIALEELQDLKSVWAALDNVWKSLQEVKETQWAVVQPRKLRQSLDNLLNIIKEMPSRMRQYAAYEFVSDTIRGYLKVNTLLADLKSEAVRERHWRMLLKQLRLEGRILLNQMLLGDVWDMDLKKNESIFKDVLVVAQGEMALEEFLRQVRDYWQAYSLELINYQNKTRLIKGTEQSLYIQHIEHIDF